MNNFYRYNAPFSYFGPYRRNLYYNNTRHSSNPFSQNVAQSNNVSHHNDSIPSSYSANSSNINPSNVNRNNSSNSFENNNSSCKNFKNLPPNSDFELDLFGLKLYFDDILIMSLLFFLYKENVKDEWLFLALILLLIS